MQKILSILLVVLAAQQLCASRPAETPNTSNQVKKISTASQVFALYRSTEDGLWEKDGYIKRSRRAKEFAKLNTAVLSELADKGELRKALKNGELPLNSVEANALKKTLKHQMSRLDQAGLICMHAIMELENYGKETLDPWGNGEYTVWK